MSKYPYPDEWGSGDDDGHAGRGSARGLSFVLLVALIAGVAWWCSGCAEEQRRDRAEIMFDSARKAGFRSVVVGSECFIPADTADLESLEACFTALGEYGGTIYVEDGAHIVQSLIDEEALTTSEWAAAPLVVSEVGIPLDSVTTLNFMDPFVVCMDRESTTNSGACFRDDNRNGVHDSGEAFVATWGER
jgi:hypothetical protein